MDRNTLIAVVIGYASMLAVAAIFAGAMNDAKVMTIQGPCTKKAQYDFEQASPYQDAILTAAEDTGLEPELIAAVILHESQGHPWAVGSSGEVGLMQTMPSTFRSVPVVRLVQPDVNILIGSRYLKEMIDVRGGDVWLGVSAYNTGPYAMHISYEYVQKVYKIKKRLESRRI